MWRPRNLAKFRAGEVYADERQGSRVLSAVAENSVRPETVPMPAMPSPPLINPRRETRLLIEIPNFECSDSIRGSSNPRRRLLFINEISVKLYAGQKPKGGIGTVVCFYINVTLVAIKCSGAKADNNIEGGYYSKRTFLMKTKFPTR